MKIRKSCTVIATMTIIMVGSIAAMEPQTITSGEFKNLVVLPKNISAGELSKIMIDEFEDGLGVSCNFCHTENRETHRPDYASDEKPEKKIARAMMRMTMGINKKYFNLRHPQIGQPSLSVTCETCHHGIPNPGQHGDQ